MLYIINSILSRLIFEFPLYKTPNANPKPIFLGCNSCDNWAKNIILKNIFSIEFNQEKVNQKIIPLVLISSGLCFSIFISQKVFKSFRDQQFLTAAATGSYTNYSREYVESLNSNIPSITATTIPIETLKVNLIYNLEDEDLDDTLHYMIAKGKSQNPFLPFNELAKSVLLIKQKKPDSAYVYAKKSLFMKFLIIKYTSIC